MSQWSPRSAAFLGEMGVGPQWSLRNPPPAALFADELPAPHAEPEPAPASSALAAASEMASVAAAPAADVMLASPEPASPEPASPEPADPLDRGPAAEVAAAPLPQAAQPDVGDDLGPAPDDTAWFDDAPAPLRPEPVSAAAIATMDWPALSSAIAGCTRCELCATRRNVVPGRGAVPATWAAIVPAPSRLDEKEQHLLSGEAGQLFDNMLKAIELGTETSVYLTPLVKCRPQSADGAERSPTLDEVTACRPFLERELALSGVTRVLTFGQVAAKGLLGAAARGKVHQHGAWSVVATYHPDDLLRKPQDKAKAWADLCLARASHVSATV